MIWIFRFLFIYLCLGLAFFYWVRFTIKESKESLDLFSGPKVLARVLVFWPIHLGYVVRRLVER